MKRADGIPKKKNSTEGMKAFFAKSRFVGVIGKRLEFKASYHSSGGDSECQEYKYYDESHNAYVWSEPCQIPECEGIQSLEGIVKEHRLLRGEQITVLEQVRGIAGVSRPKIVCLAGSTRFFREFQRAAYEAELAGVITIGPAFTPNVGPHEHGGTVGITPEQKLAVDAAFVHKIAMSDEVLVINPGGYVGESTRRDIAFARSLGKPIRWLEAEQAFAGNASR